jgi:predicted dinucleotide-binding enzyme
MAVNNLNVPGVGIQPSLIDAKGDLLVGTGNDAIDRLGVTGPTGSVLVTDAGETTGLKWVNPGTVGGLVHIETVSFSASSSESLNNVFSSTYDNYRIMFRGVTTVNSFINLRYRVDNVDNSTANSYVTQNLTGSDTTVVAVRTTDNSSTVSGLSSALTSTAVIDIFNPFDTQTTIFLSSSQFAATASIRVRAGTHNQTVSYDGFTIFPTSGTMTGSFSIYGYAKA